MTTAMAYRGPDGIEHWVRGSVALGQGMLCTTPESLEERQPLANEDESLVLVMDGRVDNAEDLRRELLARGVVPRDRTDAELALRSYEIWGEDCPDRIIGEFVFFVWDARRKRLFGARDAAGARSCYYHAGNGWFAFASEINALLTLRRIAPRLNESRLLDYLVVEFGRDDDVGTFYRDICRLPAGHAMSVSERGARTWRYWNPENLPALSFASLDDCADAFLERLRVAVRCRLRSTGPVAAMLSGGLDSSSIVALISKEFRADLKEPLKTISLIREDRENCTDWRGVQEMLKDDWLEPTILTSAVSAEVWRSCLDDIENLNEPFALSEGFTESLVFEAARTNGCRVVLDGMAADLLFFSPGRSLDCILRKKKFSLIPPLLAAYRRHGVESGLGTVAWTSLRMAAPEGLLAIYRKFWDKDRTAGKKLNARPGDLREMLNADVFEQYFDAKYARRQHVLVEPGNDRALHARNFTSALLSFAHEVIGQIALRRGVEPRSPFSDRRLIEFAIQMPWEAKVSAPWYKGLLRDSMAGILPEDLRWRRTLGGHPGHKFHERLVSEIAGNAPKPWNRPRLEHTLKRWVDVSKLGSAWDEFHRSADYFTGYNLFILAILAQWLETRPRDIFPSE